MVWVALPVASSGVATVRLEAVAYAWHRDSMQKVDTSHAPCNIDAHLQQVLRRLAVALGRQIRLAASALEAARATGGCVICVHSFPLLLHRCHRPSCLQRRRSRRPHSSLRQTPPPSHEPLHLDVCSAGDSRWLLWRRGVARW